MSELLREFINRFLDFIDSDAVESARVIADLIFCLVGVVASLRFAITGSNEILPNLAWWIISVFFVFSGTRALENTVWIGQEDEDDEEDFDDEDEEWT